MCGFTHLPLSSSEFCLVNFLSFIYKLSALQKEDSELCQISRWSFLAKILDTGKPLTISLKGFT